MDKEGWWPDREATKYETHGQSWMMIEKFYCNQVQLGAIGREIRDAGGMRPYRLWILDLGCGWLRLGADE
jgi:hypothetical protein